MKNFNFLFVVALLSMPNALKAGLELYPTFENCSYYCTVATEQNVSPTWNTDSVFRIQIQEKDSSVWQLAFRSIYDNSAKQFRGSFFHLKPNTTYLVKAELKTNDQWQLEATGTFTTWNENPTIQNTLQLSKLGAYKPNQAITLNAMKGSASGWIKIIGDSAVRAGTTGDNAVLLTNCQYVILEGFMVTGGRINGIKIDESCKEIRIINADISHWGRVPVDQVNLADATHYPSSKYANYDATYLDEKGELIRNDAGVCILTSSNNPARERFNFVIERCYIHDQNGYANPWYGVRTLGYSAGTSFTFKHPQGPHGIYIRSAGGVVVRYNDIVGADIRRLHDGSGGMDNGKVGGGYYRDSDIYGNYFGFGQDDGAEMDGCQMNVRFYNNRVEQFRCGVSCAPCLSGPSYVCGNVVADLGDSEHKDHGASIKNGGGTTYSKGLIYFLNNTMINDGNCIASVGYGSDNNQGMFQGYSRNNILYCTVQNTSYTGNCIYESQSHVNNSWDYDLLANSTRSNREGVVAVQTANSEQHAVKGNPLFTNLVNRVLTLQKYSPARGKGEFIPTWSDAAKPDMGAFSSKKSSLYPQRPFDVIVDKYQLRVNPNGSAEITLQTGEIGNDLEYWVTCSDEMSQWFYVSGTHQSAASNTNYAITCHAKVPSTYPNKTPLGVCLIRFSNGYSIPISVICDESMPTGIQTTTDQIVSVHKYCHDGKVFIVRDGVYYSILGQQSK